MREPRRRVPLGPFGPCGPFHALKSAHWIIPCTAKRGLRTRFATAIRPYNAPLDILFACGLSAEGWWTRDLGFATMRLCRPAEEDDTPGFPERREACLRTNRAYPLLLNGEAAASPNVKDLQ